MRSEARRAFFAAMLAAAPAAQADLRLQGHLHIGDGAATPAPAAPEPVSFTPVDPLHCERYSAYPSNFYLSEDSVVTAITLHDAVDLDAPLTAEFDGLRRSGSCPDCSACDGPQACGDITIALAAPVTLSRGPHTLAMIDANAPAGACDAANDYGFSALTLHGGESRHAHFSQRRHLGDRFDADDDYDRDDDLQLYPDAPEGVSVTLPFALDAALRLSEVRLYRLRDHDASGGNAAEVRVDGVLVGRLAGDGDAVLPTGLALGAGAHSVEISAGAVGGNPDDISWDDLVLRFSGDVLVPPGLFNAVDPGGHPTTGRIKTKRAGEAFELELIALGDGVPLLGYTGNVMVQLLDARESSGVTDLAGCDTGWKIADAGFAATTFTVADGGRKKVPVSHADALRIARVRITDTVLGVSGCSADAFAIQPVAFGSIAATHENPLTAGTAQTLAGGGFSGTTQPSHRAGRPFTVQARALNAVGEAIVNYDGRPDLRPVGSALGGAAGAAAASAWNGTGLVRSDNARYFEAGAARLQLVDTTFADVDAADTPAAARRIGPTEFQVGRFTPDHFRFTPLTAEFLPGCTGFTYGGQGLAFSLPPSADLTASAYGGAATRNYSDPALFKLPGPLDPSSYNAFAGAVLYAPIAPDNAVEPQAGGVARVTLLPLPPGALAFQRALPQAPFDADIAITLGPLNEGDGIEVAVPARFGNAASGEGVPFLGGGKQVRFGRLVMDNAHGSELLPLAVPLRTEYWTGAGFAPSAADSCTQVVGNPFALALDPTTLPTAVAGVPLALTFIGGRGSLQLDAPSATGTALLRGDLTAALLPWLRGDWDGDGDYNEADGSGDPAARATFGIFRNNDRRIYQREVVR